MKSGLFNEVREKCRMVAKRATFVQIAESRIASYAKSLPLTMVVNPELDPETHFLGHGDETLAFLITLDAINFGSGYFPHLRKRANKSGYFTVASALTDLYRNKGPLSAQQLANITPSDCAQIFGQDLTSEPISELMKLFATALKDLGNYLLNYFDGSFARLVDSASGSAEKLVRLLSKIPFFNDVLPYNETVVPFYKRAQITAADLSLAFHGNGPGRFDDLHELTIFADNLVPHVLRVDGILVYDESLAARIDSGELIPANSPEEVELRACALHAVELMVESLRQTTHKITSMKLDYLLWNRGQQPYYKRIHPRHRTRTVFY